MDAYGGAAFLFEEKQRLKGGTPPAVETRSRLFFSAWSG